MKRLSSILWIGSLFLLFIACHPKNGGVKNDGKDSVKTTPTGYASACAERYAKLYNPENPENIGIKEAYSESVGFYGPTVLAYLNSIDSLSERDIRVTLGVYVDPYLYNKTAAPDQQVNPDDYKGKVGRLTVFLWPRRRPKGGYGDCEECIPPLNMGELHP